MDNSHITVEMLGPQVEAYQNVILGTWSLKQHADDSDQLWLLISVL